MATTAKIARDTKLAIAKEKKTPKLQCRHRNAAQLFGERRLVVDLLGSRWRRAGADRLRGLAAADLENQLGEKIEPSLEELRVDEDRIGEVVRAMRDFEDERFTVDAHRDRDHGALGINGGGRRHLPDYSPRGREDFYACSFARTQFCPRR